jgi:hypothetical protein
VCWSARCSGRLLPGVDRRAVALIVFPAFGVQVIVGIFAFHGRDSIAATLMMSFATTWLVDALIFHSGTSRLRVPVDVCGLGPYPADRQARPLLTGSRIGCQPGRKKGPHASSWDSCELRVTHERCRWAWWQASCGNALIARNMTRTEGPDDDCHGG